MKKVLLLLVGLSCFLFTSCEDLTEDLTEEIKEQNIENQSWLTDPDDDGTGDGQQQETGR
ncbi:hypothetical protein [Tenacibaculum geojense]|uniref:Lipoprotein n=1 Tax=Tenacibaculum geojense TaxID=915352 RepID=A0ABW3JPF8_9FLAO